MVFNATFSNISVISWWSVLLVEETGDNHRPVASHGQTLSHNVVSSTPRHEDEFNDYDFFLHKGLQGSTNRAMFSLCFFFN